MLHDWMKQDVLLYGMIGSGVLGALCLLVINHFYSRTIRDLCHIMEPKGRWTKEFIEEYQMRNEKEQEIHNPEAFIHTQLSKGKMFGISLQGWKQGIAYGAFFCFACMMVAVYGIYHDQQPAMNYYPYILLGACVLIVILLGRQMMGFSGKEETVFDGLMDYMENTAKGTSREVDFDLAKEQAKEELICQVTKGIEQGLGETKFSHMMTPEEEHLVREVIKEYLA